MKYILAALGIFCLFLATQEPHILWIDSLLVLVGFFDLFLAFWKGLE